MKGYRIKYGEETYSRCKFLQVYEGGEPLIIAGAIIVGAALIGGATYAGYKNGQKQAENEIKNNQ